MLLMLLAILLLLAGIGLLYAGGELLVDSAIRVAKSFKVSNMVIGLTVVAFGTAIAADNERLSIPSWTETTRPLRCGLGTR